ncbi:hypothetical protein RAZWK3B_07999 [Roseobacter sp. AzwK-3b]|uniref:DUF6746 family protein n=1 Tax=Roseobacter sp. AzwK-3b TaxID=351016 RepID=UPI000156A3F5|nr:DUF6746 family protein [Roseobacter sp. AzwK-3b]EDM69737.1 hypothetical protein RAZWK3B_07999 [Roseobacter sp. AzwK-3b]
MKHTVGSLVTAAAITLGHLVPATAEQVTHYAPEPSETLEQAVENFAKYNAKLANVLDRDPLTTADMEEVHEYTYTLEIALAKINEELGALPVVLEEVHQTSEGDDPERLRAAGEAYLAQARLLDR